MRKLFVIAICAVFGLSAGSAWAGGRPDKSYKNWFGHMGLGYNLAQGALGDIADDDWSISGGATYWPEGRSIGINLDLSWAEYDATSETIQNINDNLEPGSTGSVTGGNLESWSATVNALWSPKRGGDGKLGFYVAAGVGAYYLDAQLTDTGLVLYPPICGWYWCTVGGIGTGDYEVAGESGTEFGWNAGVGLTFDVGADGSQIFLEAKYHWVDSAETVEFVPITLGYRW